MILVRKLALPLVILTATALLAGCEASVSTGDDNVDADEVTSKITSQYKEQTDLTLTEINCDEVEAKVGATFSCTAKNSADVSLEIDGKVNKLDESTDEAKFKWDTVKAVAGPTTFTSTAVDALKGVGKAVKSIDCPGGTEIKKGEVIECTGTMDDGSKRKVKITLTNGNGAIHVDLLGPA